MVLMYAVKVKEAHHEQASAIDKRLIWKGPTEGSPGASRLPWSLMGREGRSGTEHPKMWRSC